MSVSCGCLRREWGSLAVALGWTIAVVAASFVLGPIGLPARLFAVAVLVIWGARTDRRWVVPVGAAIAAPFLWWNVLAMLVAAVPLLDPNAWDRIAPIPSRRNREAVA